jgi:hypothetical protein
MGQRAFVAVREVCLQTQRSIDLDLDLEVELARPTLPRYLTYLL